MHQAGLFDSDETLVDLLAPFIGDGVAGGEPVVAVLSAGNWEAIRPSLPDSEGVTFIPADRHYVRPASTLQSYRDLIEHHLGAGAERIRVVGEVPHPGVGVEWDGWVRYEAAFNHAFGQYPLWVVCPYDRRTAPPAVLEEVHQTHPFLWDDTGFRANPRFEDPAAFLGRGPSSPSGPLEKHPPDVDLRDPRPADARRAVEQCARNSGLNTAGIQSVVLATNEALTDSMLHGDPPVLVRAWSHPGRVVVKVHDRGEGPDDAFAGLLPASNGHGGGGLGLCLAHQVCDSIALTSDGSGFTVRLIMGTPSGVGDRP